MFERKPITVKILKVEIDRESYFPGGIIYFQYNNTKRKKDFQLVSNYEENLRILEKYKNLVGTKQTINKVGSGKYMGFEFE